MESNTQNTAPQSIGKRIMALRKAAGMTQDQLAQKLGVTPQAVSKWENEVSCPDISLLPRIAETFEVSTDSLLGRAELDTAHVRAAYAEEKKEVRRSKRGGIWFGIFVALAGLALLCGEFISVPFKPWAVIWSGVILALGVLWMIRRFSFFALGLGLLGLYYLMKNLGASMPFALSWGIAIPAFLILLGLTVLWDHLFPRSEQKDWEHWNENSAFAKRHAVTAFSDDEGAVNMQVTCAESSYTTKCESFHGGSMGVSFGHGTLDLRSLRNVQNDAALNVDVSFGCGEIWLPLSLRAETGICASVGDVEQHGAPYPDAKPIRLTGNVSFGSLEIYYK